MKKTYEQLEQENAKLTAEAGRLRETLMSLMQKMGIKYPCDCGADFLCCRITKALTQKNITSNDLLRQAESRIGYLEGENRKLFAETAALTAELAERDKSIIAASNAADKAEQNHKRCIAQVESLRRELSKLAAENKRMREALMKIMTWWPTVSYARMTLLIDPMQVCREALAPSEKPAPDVAIIGPDGTGCATGASAVPAPDGEGRKQCKYCKQDTEEHWVYCPNCGGQEREAALGGGEGK